MVFQKSTVKILQYFLIVTKWKTILQKSDESYVILCSFSPEVRPEILFYYLSIESYDISKIFIVKIYRMFLIVTE